MSLAQVKSLEKKIKVSRDSKQMTSMVPEKLPLRSELQDKWQMEKLEKYVRKQQNFKKNLAKREKELKERKPMY